MRMVNSQWSIYNGGWPPFVRIAILLCCLLIVSNVSIGQKVTTLLSKDKIVIGEQVTLKIEVQGVSANEVLQDFRFPDTVNHIEVLTDSLESEGSSFIHTLTLTSFDSGYWQFPSYELTLANNRKVTSQAVDISVLPVDVSSLKDYHDIKDILDVEAENNWWIIAAIVALGLVSLFAFLWVATNKTPAPKEITSSSDLADLYNKLMKRLSLLESESNGGKLSNTEVYKESSQLARSYVDAAYNVQTAHLTSGEHMLYLKGKLPDAETETGYFQFLRLADAVKFARYQPPANETNHIFSVLKALALQVLQQNKQKS